MSDDLSQRPADAAPDNWVDRFAPPSSRPYLRLLRADRPVGVWLLLWPCWWSIALAEAQVADNTGLATPDLRLLFLFAVGAFVMRSAGCVINDIWDREIDAKVARTAGRPIASGAISVKTALVVLLLMCGIGLLVLLQLGCTSIIGHGVRAFGAALSAGQAGHLLATDHARHRL